MKTRKTLTKSLHTVTAVSRVALHLMEEGHNHHLSSSVLVARALHVLGQPDVWPEGDPTVAACVAALDKLRNA